MTYATSLSSEGIKSNYLVVIKPRRLASVTWTLVSGTIYKQLFDYGQVIDVKSDDTELTEDTSTAPTSGKWYWNSADNYLYVNNGGNPASSDITCTYEIYVGTFDAHFYRIPTDSSSRVVYYEPVIMRSPEVKLSTTDSLFGFMPTQSSNVTLSNATHFLEYHLYDSSFNQADIDLYHWLGTLSVSNIKLVFKGICKGITYNDKDISISVYDRNDIFNKNYTNPVGDITYKTSTFAQLDPSFEGRPIRRFFGMVDGVVPVNVDYLRDSPGNTDNRRHVVGYATSSFSNMPDITATVKSSPASTDKRTYLDSADGLNVGDSVWFDKASDEYKYITAVNKTGDHYIEHDTLSAACTTGELVKRGFIGSVTIYKDNVEYKAMYRRDYTTYNGSLDKVCGFDFSTTMESNLSMPVSAFIQPSDIIFCRVYGEKTTFTLGGSPVGTDSATYGNVTNPALILYGLAKESGLAESDIDLTTIGSFISAITEEIGFAIPKNSSNEFPTYKEIFVEILFSVLLKIFINNDNKWSFYQTGPAGSVDKTIEDDEILLDSFSYILNYNDLITDCFLDYAYREVTDKFERGGSFSRVSSVSSRSKRLHKESKQKTFKSLHIGASDAQVLCNRLLYIFSDRLGTVKLSTKNRFFDTLLGDIIKVKRTRLPGYSYDSDTARERSCNVLSTSKSLKEISLELDDQKGIEDNAGSW